MIPYLIIVLHRTVTFVIAISITNIKALVFTPLNLPISVCVNRFKLIVHRETCLSRSLLIVHHIEISKFPES